MGPTTTTLPPGPTSPMAVQTLNWIVRPLPTLESHGARYGDIFTMKLPAAVDVVLVSNPSAIKEVFALGPDEAHAGEANFILRPILGDQSLLLLDGASHIRHRKMMMPAFHGERMHAYGKTMIAATHASIERWQTGRTFKLHDRMQQIALDIILRTVFGIEDGPRFVELADLLTRGLEIAAWPGLLFGIMQKDYGAWSPWARFKKVMARVREILIGEIRAVREKGEGGTAGRTDVLAMLLDTRDEKGAPLTEDELHDELITLLVAGHETTATALAWAFRYILADEALGARVQGEATRVADDVGLIAKSELLEGCVKEALRVQPVIPLVGRVLKQPLSLLGWELPAGTAVLPAIHLVHRRPSLYPHPTRFDPDRYKSWKPTTSEWIPFGGGLRRCIGAAFATFEMKMVLATVMSRVSMQLAPSFRDRATGRARGGDEHVRVMRRGITLTPAGGLPVVVTVKKSRQTRRDAKDRDDSMAGVTNV